MEKIPWRERVNALSVNPNAATHEHIVRMATELHGFWLNEKGQYQCKNHSAGTGCVNDAFIFKCGKNACLINYSNADLCKK